MNRLRIAGAGIAVLLLLLLAPAPAQARAATRQVWIAAVPTTWNVVPNGRNPIEGERFTPEKTTMDTFVYVRYTRGWRTRLPRQTRIPGPLLRARVGDHILVHFLNRDPKRPHSMHFHGVRYPFGSDGSFIPGFSGEGGAVQPGKSFTYRLRAGVDSAGVWPYHGRACCPRTPGR